MQHQRDAGGGEIDPFAGNLGGEFRRHLPEHLGEVDAGLLEDAAIGQDARTAAAAAGPLPEVLAEPARAIDLLQAGADAVLQVFKKGYGLILVRC